MELARRLRASSWRSWADGGDSELREQMPLDSFIHQQNLERFRRLLAQSTDESQRAQIRKLLAEEEAKDLRDPPSLGGQAA